MNDKEMIKKIQTTFTGPDHIDNAVLHYQNARKNLSIDDAYQSVLRFLNDDIEYFKCLTRDDILKVKITSGLWCTDVKYTLRNIFSIKITKWPDGYEISVHKPISGISDSKCGLSFEEAREMVEGWEYETGNS